MAKGLIKWLMIANLLIASSAVGRAQNFDVGMTEFLSSCAACHGADGKGNGPLRQVLKSTPSDLTTLSKKNNGVFPKNAVYEIIDGRKFVEAHGPREMPIWGFRYIPSPYEALHPTGGDRGSEATIRLHILALVDHLSGMQEK